MDEERGIAIQTGEQLIIWQWQKQTARWVFRDPRRRMEFQVVHHEQQQQHGRGVGGMRWLTKTKTPVQQWHQPRLPWRHSEICLGGFVPPPYVYYRTKRRTTTTIVYDVCVCARARNVVVVQS